MSCGLCPATLWVVRANDKVGEAWSAEASISALIALPGLRQRGSTRLNQRIEPPQCQGWGTVRWLALGSGLKPLKPNTTGCEPRSRMPQQPELKEEDAPSGLERQVRPFGPITVTAEAVTSKTAQTAQTAQTIRTQGSYIDVNSW
jgi:hypothetical protein